MYDRSQAKSAARELFTGVWSAITTPFNDDLSLNVSGLERDVAHVVDGLDAGGIFCGGVMGEFWSLTNEERRLVTETVVETSNAPVLAHTGAHSAEETIELTRHAHEIGADFAVIINPYYPIAEQLDIRSWFLRVINSVDIGIWLFDTNYSGTQLSLELIDELADIENVCGIKVGHTHERYLETLEKVGERIIVCEANEAEWLSNIVNHGQTVYMSSAVPFLYQTPESKPMNEYTALALSGDVAGAEAIQAGIAELRELNAKWLHGRWVQNREIPIPYIKAWQQLMGMTGGAVRSPLRSISDSDRAELENDLRRVGLVA